MLKTQALMKKLDEQKAAMLRDVAKIAATHSYASPEDWSAAQIVSHLAKTESEFIIEIQKGLATQNPAPTFKQKMRGLALRGALLSPMKFAMPPQVAVQIAPEAEADLHTATEAWAVERARLHAVIDPLQSVPAGAVFRHPVSGWMDLMNTLRVLRAHAFHHKYQLRRLQKA